MTRRDLEEVVMNLEYLVVNHFDTSKTEEYEQLLETFRRDLQKLNLPQLGPTPMGGRSHVLQWDRTYRRPR